MLKRSLQNQSMFGAAGAGKIRGRSSVSSARELKKPNQVLFTTGDESEEVVGRSAMLAQKESLKNCMNDPVGLRILIERSGKDLKVLNNAGLRSDRPMIGNGRSVNGDGFLKACHLCKKKLNHDKDVYMYRGEPFCTVDCRCRQIYMDEMGEREAYVRQRAPPRSPRCLTDNRVRVNGPVGVIGKQHKLALPVG